MRLLLDFGFACSDWPLATSRTVAIDLLIGGSLGEAAGTVFHWTSRRKCFLAVRRKQAPCIRELACIRVAGASGNLYRRKSNVSMYQESEYFRVEDEL